MLLSCISKCKDAYDVIEFYAESNPLNPNEVTKLHIIIDKVYHRPIKVTSNDGYIITDVTQVFDERIDKAFLLKLDKFGKKI